jgi:hypothetical protein
MPEESMDFGTVECGHPVRPCRYAILKHPNKTRANTHLLPPTQILCW